MIEKLSNPLVLANVNYRLPFKLHTHASVGGLKVVLYRHQAEFDSVIAYFSCSLKLAERNYPVHKLDVLALKLAVTDKFYNFINFPIGATGLSAVCDCGIS